VSTAAGAAKWQETAAAKAALTATASHCNDADTPDALSDGLLPKNSDDREIPRLTWWSHKGTPEWVAYRFAKPRTVSWSDVYWFDDTGHGQCRLPASWQLLYKAGGEWKPVKLTDGAAYGVEKDKFNKVTFEPVETSELRLEVKLRPDFSGGILEWRVGPPAK